MIPQHFLHLLIPGVFETLGLATDIESGSLGLKLAPVVYGETLLRSRKLGV